MFITPTLAIPHQGRGNGNSDPWVETGEGLGYTLIIHVHLCSSVVPFSRSACSTFSAVIGRVVVRTPTALEIALAKAGAMARIAGSPMPRTP